ncbi:hypothetical protein Tco_0154128 [Tanacetum coccineum]
MLTSSSAFVHLGSTYVGKGLAGISCRVEILLLVVFPAVLKSFHLELWSFNCGSVFALSLYSGERFQLQHEDWNWSSCDDLTRIFRLEMSGLFTKLSRLLEIILELLFDLFLDDFRSFRHQLSQGIVGLQVKYLIYGDRIEEKSFNILMGCGDLEGGLICAVMDWLHDGCNRQLSYERKVAFSIVVENFIKPVSWVLIQSCWRRILKRFRRTLLGDIRD